MKPDIFWVEGPWTGRLAIVSRPRGGDWLEDEIQAWRDAGLNVVVSTLQPEEVADFDLIAEAIFCRTHQIEFISFGIEDRQVPDSLRDTGLLAKDLAAKLAAGKNVAVHCRQGIGRSALLAACVLVVGDLGVATAFQRLSKARGCTVPETAEQQAWAKKFAQALATGLLD